MAELVAKNMKSHTIAASLIMPACKMNVKTMLNEKTETETSKVPDSNDTLSRHNSDNTISRHDSVNTISRYVDDKSNISDILPEILQNTEFTLQIDETDITGKA